MCVVDSPQVTEDSSLRSPQSSTSSQTSPAVTQLPLSHVNSSFVQLSPGIDQKSNLLKIIKLYMCGVEVKRRTL